MQVNICSLSHTACEWRGNATYRLRIVKVLHNNSFDIAIVILQGVNIVSILLCPEMSR